jgi:pyruvate dehydrogenase E2 component (dihydrolipoamide acetyltransferase)
MPTDVIMPALGMAQTTGVVVQWKKQAGDQVSKGEPLLEVETDKAVVEVEAPASGTLSAISAEAGAEVPVGTAIAIILGAGESAPVPSDASSPGAQASAPATADAAAPAEEASAVEPVAPAAPAARGSEARLQAASPLARRLAAEGGVNLASVAGTGPGGAVQATDLPEAATDQKDDVEEEVEVAAGRTWRIMAERTAAGWTAPHFYLTREVMADALTAFRANLAAEGEKVTVTDLLVRVSALVLKDHPRLCSAWKGGRLVKGSRISVGVAVASEDGLTVPVLHDADRKSLAEIAAWREATVERARSRRLKPEDLEGGVFTITNLGMHGVDAFTAILNGGEASILAVGRIAERAVARKGVVSAAQTMILTLGCDHRAVDGARGALFLKDLVAALEEPAKLLR